MHINLQGLHVYKTKPKRCVNCASQAIACYVFGYPNSEVVADQLLPTLKQKYQIGGCQIPTDRFEKTWHCKKCRKDFYYQNPNFIAQGKSFS
jgi:hypothetical protein